MDADSFSSYSDVTNKYLQVPSERRLHDSMLLLIRMQVSVARLCGMHSRALRGLESVGNGFDHALWSNGWNNSRDLVIGCIEQSTKLSGGTFPSSVHY
jgi:hypothetical protein